MRCIRMHGREALPSRCHGHPSLDGGTGCAGCTATLEDSVDPMWAPSAPAQRPVSAPTSRPLRDACFARKLLRRTSRSEQRHGDCKTAQGSGRVLCLCALESGQLRCLWLCARPGWGARYTVKRSSEEYTGYTNLLCSLEGARFSTVHDCTHGVRRADMQVRRGFLEVWT